MAESTSIEAIYPLTALQHGMLFDTIAEPSSPLYFQQFVATASDLDIPAFQRAWERLVARHQALRSLIAWEGRDRPLRIVRPAVAVPWVFEDWTAEMDQRGRLDEWLAEDRRRPFDLRRAPLTRFALFDLGAGRHQFVWSYHHIILDGWSTRLLTSELATFVDAEQRQHAATPPAPPPYERFLDSLQTVDQAAAADFWRAHLAPTAGPTLLRPATPSERWARHHLREELSVPDDRARAVETGIRKLGVTFSTVFQAAWGLVLRAHTNEAAPIFGVTLSGREAEVEDIERMVGMLINTLPRRLAVQSEATVADWIGDVHRAGVDWADHQQHSIVDIKRWIDWERPEPIFDTVVVTENVPAPDGDLFDDVEHLERSSVPLALLAVPGSDMRLVAIADADRYEAATLRRLLTQVSHVMWILTTSSDATVDSIEVIPPEESAELETYETGSSVELPHETAASMLLAGMVKDPTATAVVGPDGSLTYGELYAAAQDIAPRLRDHGVGRGDLVGIESHRSTLTVAAIVGCVLAGIPYVPIDPSTPPVRREQILEGVTCVIASDGTLTVRQPGSGHPVAGRPAPDDLVYVMFTSGSTGVPKGVEVTQAALAASTQVRRHVYEGQVDAFLVTSPLHFDSSVAGLFWALADGGTVVLPSDDDRLEPEALRSLIRNHDVSHLLTLPSVYRLLLDGGGLSPLRTAIVAGETCPPAVVRDHFASQPDVELFNEYGPTEATVWCSVQRMESADGSASRIPIGRPIPLTTVLVGDPSSGPSPIGVPGEILVSGPQLARGYRGDPIATHASFIDVAWPGRQPVRAYRTGDVGRWRSDGTLEFLGRVDNQVKLRGHRVELDEIDARLREHPDISDAVTVAMGGTPVDRLVAYVVAPSVPTDLGSFVRTALPDVMVPSQFVAMDRLPQGSTGKVDRAALPEPPVDSPVGIERTLSGTESVLAEVWSEVLGFEISDPHADFFGLGGDSLAAMRIVARARKRGLELRARDFFTGPTIADLAKTLPDE